MSDVLESRESDAQGQSWFGEDLHVGISTRAISWVIDAVLINFVAIMAAVGTAVVLSTVPLAQNLEPAFKVIAAGVYVLWCAAYFIAFWAITGQTPGARVMRIQLVTAKRERVKPARAVLRWVGMNLAMLPLFAGYVPILFSRRPFPDWLAHTLVLDLQPSVARAHPTHLAARDGSSTTASPEPSVSPGGAIGNSGHRVDQAQHRLVGDHEATKLSEHRRVEP